MTPAVSVIIPTYNRAHTLARSIESVLGQSFRDFEIIVIDDGSTDDTDQVVSNYVTNHHVQLITQPHRGAAAACNHGIRHARGKYIAFQGSDDEWLPEKLERALSAHTSGDARTGVFYSDMLRVLPDGQTFIAHAPRVERGSLIDDETLDFSVVGIGSNSTVIRRECFERIGLFDENLPRFIDLDLFLRLLREFDFVYTPEPLVKWHMAQGMTTDSAARVRARLYLRRKYRELFRGNRARLAGQYLQLARAFACNQQRAQTYRYVLQALFLSPRNEMVRAAAQEILRKAPV